MASTAPTDDFPRLPTFNLGTEYPADRATSGLPTSDFGSDGYLNLEGLPVAPERYVLVRLLAEGGMGAVYLAFDRVLNREVALKTVQPGGPADAANRFREEALITGQLQHPAIPPVHDLGTLPDGRPFLAMKLIQGQTLWDQRQGLDGPSGMTGRDLAIFEQLCQAMAYAHSRGIIHRDLKPSNIMVGAFGEVQVMDWGLAKVLSRPSGKAAIVDGSGATVPVPLPRPASSNNGSTEAGTILGTPAFMPPEQALGDNEQVDEHADVFALGAILCYLLTGKPPYAELDTAAEICRQAAAGELADAWRRLDASGADPDLVKLTQRCLAPDKELRPANAAAVAAAIAQYRAATEERARQADLHRLRAEEQAQEERKRRFLWRSWAAVLMLGLVSTLVLAWWANRERAQAVLAEERTYQAFEDFTSVEGREYFMRLNRVAPQQRALLKKAADYFGDAAQRAASDAGSQTRAVACYLQLGHLQALLGDWPRAEEAQRAAVRLTEAMLAKHPEELEWQRLCARACHDLACTLQHDPEAMVHFRRSISLREARLAQAPDDVEARFQLARTYDDLAKMLNDGDEAENREALRLITEVENLITPLAEQYPDDVKYELMLTKVGHTKAVTLSNLKDLMRAQEGVRQSLARAQKLAKLHPRNLEVQVLVAASMGNLALGHLALAETSQAVKTGQAAIAEQEKLVAEFPATPSLRLDVTRTYFCLAEALDKLGRAREAQATYRAAIAHCERLAEDFAEAPDHWLQLAQSRHQYAILLDSQGQRPEAEKEFAAARSINEKLVERYPRKVTYRHALASSLNSVGVMLYDQGQPAAALPWFAKAENVLAPTLSGSESKKELRRLSLFIHWSRAEALERSGRFPEAIADWQAALKLGGTPQEQSLLKQGRRRSQVLSVLFKDSAWPLLWGWPWNR